MNLVKSKLGIISLLIILFSAALFAGCGETNINFNVSGTLVCHGTPISNATITTDKGDTVTTDENGAFVFSDLSEAVILSFSATGYVFKTENVAVFKETHDLVIEAEEMYTLTGRVESHGIGIHGALVTATGLVDRTSYTDSNGCFVINNVAGETVVSVEKQNYTFERKVATINNSNLVFSGSTAITVTVSGADGATLMVGDKKLDYQNGVYTASDILLGSVVVPSLAGYHFEPSQIVVSRENAELEFRAYPIYAVTGTTTSGGVAIGNVSISVNGNALYASNENGEFTISNLWGQNVLSFSHPVFNFTNVSVDSATNIEATGTFTLTGYVFDNATPLSGVYVVGNGETFTDMNGQFTLENVSLNDTITFQKDNFIIDSVTVTDTIMLNVMAIAQFDATLTVLCDGTPLEGAVVSVNGDIFETDTYGKVTFYDFTNSFVANIECEGYTSASANFSRDNAQITVSLNKIYDATLNIRSGDIEISGATVYYNDTMLTLEGSEITISDLTSPLTIRAEASGFEPMTLFANKDNVALDFNLCYIVSGKVLNGDKVVSGTVEASDTLGAKTEANIIAGDYTLRLYGKNTITVSAAGLDFDTVEVEKGRSVNFYASYSISGALSAEGEMISGARVVLISNSDASKNCETTTNAEGKYTFENLSGEYTLFTTNTNITLLPNTYTVSKGGEYNFDANGYAVSGKVMNGTLGLAGVTVRANGTTTVTNEYGEFSFPMLMGNVTITAEKTGYTFNESYNITPSDAGRVLDFTSTYRVEGVVMSGTTALEGVTVRAGAISTVTNNLGRFTLEGLENANTLEFSKVGYTFENESISGYENLSIAGTYTLKGRVLVGSTALSGVVVSNSSESVETNALGEFSLAGVSIGDIITATSAGYNFNTVTAIGYGESVEFSGTFGVSGIVKSNGRAVAGVVVTLGELSTTTNTAGRFEFSNINIYGTMTFTLSGYDFNPVEVTGPASSLEVLATFAVNGRVTINGEGLEGVSISANGVSTTTDESGCYTLTGLSTSGYLSVEKQGTTSGYDFTGTKYFPGATTLDFTASYWVMVSISSGTVSINDSQLSLTTTSGRLEAIENGIATIRGILDTATITAHATRYNDSTITVTAPEDNLHINLTYSIILNLNGVTLDNATVYYSHEGGEDTATISNISFEIKDIVGAGSWSISRENCQFSPSSGNFSGPRGSAIEISCTLEYSISGRITVENTSIGVSGMTVSFGGKTTKTDSNGYYTLTGLYAAPGQLTATFEAENCDTLTAAIAVNGAGTYNISNIKNNDFAYWLWQKGYQNLREAPAYRSITKGVVNGGTLGGVQTMGGIKAKDSTGKYLAQNINYCAKDIIMVGDVSVAYVGFYDLQASGNNMWYKQLEDRVNIQLDNTGTWFLRNYASKSWNETTLSGIRDLYGNDPTMFYSYDFSQAPITYSEVKLDEEGNYTFKFSFSGNNAIAITKEYLKQMERLSGQKPTFKKVELTYTVDKNGNLKKIVTHEEYNAIVDIIGDMTETYEVLGEDFRLNRADYEINELA